MTNYDRWLEQPYQQDAEQQQFEEQMAEHEWQQNYTEVIDSLDVEIPVGVTDAYRDYLDNKPRIVLAFDAWLEDLTPIDIFRYIQNKRGK